MIKNLFLIVVIPLLIFVAILEQWDLRLILIAGSVIGLIVFILFAIAMLFYRIARPLFYRSLIQLSLIGSNRRDRHTFEIIAIVFLILKIGGAIDWAWWLVLSPIFIAIALGIFANSISPEVLSKRYIELTTDNNSDKTNPNSMQQDERTLIEETVVKLNRNESVDNLSPKILTKAKDIATRVERQGYNFISCHGLAVFWLLREKEKERDPESENFLLINVSPSSNSILGSKFFQVPDANKEVDSLLREGANNPIAERKFAEILGNNLDKMIVFYGTDEKEILFFDEENNQYFSGTQADVACLWARKLGYTKIFKLAGGLKAWIRYGFAIDSTERIYQQLKEEK